MIVAAYILGALIVAGVILRLTHKDDPTPAAAEEVRDDAVSEECCGMHITCERDSLLTALADKIEYFDDEELDCYAGREADAYSDGEIEQFRDVLLTLKPDEIAAWGRSVQLRGITLPATVRDELLMIVSEARASLSNS